MGADHDQIGADLLGRAVDALVRAVVDEEIRGLDALAVQALAQLLDPPAILVQLRGEALAELVLGRRQELR